jgi:chemotaxis protein methyltransferase CheR
MTLEEFLLLDELIAGEIGISFPEHQRELLAARLRPRLQALHLRHFHDYYLQLQCDLGGERARLAELIANHETYFFREMKQIEALFAHALAGLRTAAAPAALRLLCAGCSSGEEPYTLAICARQHRCGLAGTSLRIDAFDADASRLDMARRALYGPGSLRATSDELRQRCFTPRGAESWELNQAHRRGPRFFQGNIIDLHSFTADGPYDVVFCRNVLIYFSEAALRQAVDHFATVLRPGGLLFVGTCESIIGLSSRLETVRLGPAIAYRKVGR